MIRVILSFVILINGLFTINLIAQSTESEDPPLLSRNLNLSSDWFIIKSLPLSAVNQNSTEEIQFSRGGITLVASVAGALVVICILLHYEVLRGLTRLLRKLREIPRARILVLILGLFFIHLTEIWIFASGYYFMASYPEYGYIMGELNEGFMDYVYYSAMVYTTVGFGDLIPSGTIRFLTSMEALSGFMLITWSASFTFLEMQRFWKD
jgi:hypothetical protein